MEEKKISLKHTEIERIARGDDPSRTLMEVYLARNLLKYKEFAQVKNDLANKYYGFCYKIWLLMEKADGTIHERRNKELERDIESKKKRLVAEMEKLNAKTNKDAMKKIIIDPPINIETRSIK